MPKGSDTLTGGTRDVNPQWFKPAQVNFGVQTPATGIVTNTVTFQLPVTRFSPKNGKSIIIEILKVRWATANNGVVGNSAGLFSYSGYLCTNPNPNPVSTQGRVIDWLFDEQFQYNPALALVAGVGYTMAGSVTETPTYPITHDLTDGAGHGMLVATDSMSIIASAGVFDVAPAGTSSVYTAVPQQNSAAIVCEFLYRFKEVSLQEYVGIVQSQQAGQ